jgi:lipoprotein-anchoring transpeptidase ErfK/SrfK
MRKALLIVTVLLVGLGGGGASALYAYDASRAELLAEGVAIGGVDVGGLTIEEARALVRQRLLEPLSRDVVVIHGKRGWVVPPDDLRVRTDLEAPLREAIETSRSGNFLRRAYRDLTGGRLRADLPLDVTYSDEAVVELVRRVKATLDLQPREAKSAVSLTGVRISPSRKGTAVRARELEHALRSQLVRPTDRRLVHVPVRILRPEVTTAELEARFERLITISRRDKKLRLFVRGRLAKSYGIAVGRIGYETPKGLYEIRNKAADPAWYVPNKSWAGELAGQVIAPDDPRNPIKARWMGFYSGAGIHGTPETDSIGSAASHGCIRMTVPDVIDLYERVAVHTPVYIA